MELPSTQCGGYATAERQQMLENIIAAPGAFGQPSVPDVGYPWVRLLSANYMILERPGFGPIAYKLFEGSGNFRILAISRGRQRSSPQDPVCRFDLCFFRQDVLGLAEIDGGEILPTISILDFITKETLTDPDAVRDVTALAPDYHQCLTSNLSVNEAAVVDVMTSTSLSAAACNRFLPQFDLLPLTWNGRTFTKPYDRAAPPQ